MALLDRLIGLETEYAIRYSSIPDEHLGRAPSLASWFERDFDPLPHPGNDIIFQAFKTAIADLVPTRPGNGAPGRDQVFTANGGAFYYEFLPHCPEGGLLECATPECRGPSQLLLYQRAQERMLVRALPKVEELLARSGHTGTVGLLKNCRDAEGNIYGSQENYEVEIASGVRLTLYRLGLTLLLPLLLVQTVLTYAFIVLLILGSLGGILALMVVSVVIGIFYPPWLERVQSWFDADPRTFEKRLGPFHLWLTIICTWPVVRPMAWLLSQTAFRPQRHAATAFLVTRTVLSGSGAVDAGRRFRLAQKVPTLSGMIRKTVLPEERTLFDTGNLLKMLCSPFNGQWRPVFRLYRRRQRLQLGHGDSNRSDLAELLKIGSTGLILDLIEQGVFDDAPQLRDPVTAAHAVAYDLDLDTPLELVDGTTMTALEIQRFYLGRLQETLKRSAVPSMEAHQLADLWDEGLSALETGRFDDLVGRVDWATKRLILDHCGEEASVEVLQTLDLRYHELGVGYYEQLADSLPAPALFEDSTIDGAIHEPPTETPAFLRGQLIRERVQAGLPLVVSWDSAVLGRPFSRGKVIPFRRPKAQ